MSVCTKYSDDLKALVDGELPIARRWVVERHVAACEPCRDEVAAMRQIGDGLRLQPLEPLDAALRARILAAIPDRAPESARRPIPRRFSLALAGSAVAIALLIFVFRPAHDEFMDRAGAPGPASAPLPRSVTFSPVTPKAGDSKPVADSNHSEPVSPAMAAPPSDVFRKRSIPPPAVTMRTETRAAVVNKPEARESEVVRHDNQPAARTSGARSDITLFDSHSRSQPEWEARKMPASISRFGANLAAAEQKSETQKALDKKVETPALQAQNGPAQPTVAAGRIVHQQDRSKESLGKVADKDSLATQSGAGGNLGIGAAPAGAAGMAGFGGAGGGGGFGGGRPDASVAAQRGSAPPAEAGRRTNVNGQLALGAQMSPLSTLYGRDAGIHPSSSGKTALLKLDVENLEQKRGEVAQITRAANGTVTAVSGEQRRDNYSLDYAASKTPEETELLLEVDAAKMTGVLDKLSRLGDVTVRQVPAPAQAKVQDLANRNQDSNYRFRAPLQERAEAGTAGSTRGETQLRQEMTRSFGDSREQSRLKTGAALGRGLAPGAVATITLVLREKKDRRPAAAAKPAQEPMKK
jgi:hypothetical protein